MTLDEIQKLADQLSELRYEVGQLSERMDALESEMRISIHRHEPLMSEMRRELSDMKSAVERLGSGDAGIPIEATQPPPRR